MKRITVFICTALIVNVLLSCKNLDNPAEITNSNDLSVEIPSIQNMNGTWEETVFFPDYQSGRNIWTINADGNYELDSSWVSTDDPEVTQYRRYKGTFTFNSNGYIQQHQLLKADSIQPITDENVNWYSADQETGFFGVLINNKFHKSYHRISAEESGLIGNWEYISFDSDYDTPYYKLIIKITDDSYITNTFYSVDGISYTDNQNEKIYGYLNDGINKKINLYQNESIIGSVVYVISTDWLALYRPELEESKQGWIKQ